MLILEKSWNSKAQLTRESKPTKEKKLKSNTFFTFYWTIIGYTICILFCSAVCAKQQSRVGTLKKVISEAFIENASDETSLRTNKTEEFANARSAKKDVEYLTLHKILSFLHAACLRHRQFISHADLTRCRFSFVLLFCANFERLFFLQVGSWRVHTNVWHPSAARSGHVYFDSTRCKHLGRDISENCSIFKDTKGKLI